MATFGDLTDEVIGNLQGYTLTPDMVTYTTATVDEAATVIPIDMPEGGTGIGLIEVGDELMYVSRVDVDAGTLRLLPKGRGWRGTTAVAHAQGETVTVAPLVPRHRVKQAVNDTIASLWPSLFAVATVEIPWTPGPTFAVPLPDDAEQILDVRYRDQHGNWLRVRRFEAVRSMADDFATGSALRITEYPPFATTVQVVYGKRPTPLLVEEDDVVATGLPAAAKDLLVLGAMARLVPALDAGRLSVQYVPADELDQPRQLGSAMALAREFKKDYELTLARQQAALQNLYPARVHFVSAR